MASPSVTTSARGMAGVGNTVTAPTPSTKLVAHWKISNGTAATDFTLTDSSGNSNDLRTRGSVNTSAGFWTTPYGVFNSATITFFGSASPTAMEIGALNTSFIFSCRVKSSAAAFPSAAAAIMSKKNQATATGINLLINTNGTLIQQSAESGGANQNLTCTTDVCDTAEHSIVFAVDRTGDRIIYVDGADDYAAGTKDMTTANLDGDMSAATTGLQLGGQSTLLDSGSINNPLFTAGVTISMRDVHLYMTTGALPSNLDLLAYYLSSNVYSPIPASLWA